MANKCIKINLCLLVLSVYNISFSQSLIGNNVLMKFNFYQLNSLKDNFRQDKVLGTGRRRKTRLSETNHSGKDILVTFLSIF